MKNVLEKRDMWPSELKAAFLTDATPTFRSGREAHANFQEWSRILHLDGRALRFVRLQGHDDNRGTPATVEFDEDNYKLLTQIAMRSIHWNPQTFAYVPRSHPQYVQMLNDAIEIDANAFMYADVREISDEAYAALAFHAVRSTDNAGILSKLDTSRL